MSFEPIIETGSYTGNGGTQSITIGWQPAYVEIVSTRTTGSAGTRAVGVKLADHPGDDWLENAGAAGFITANGVTLTSTGFSVGSDSSINQNNITFHWKAIRASPAVQTGVYDGNGLNDRSFAGVLAWQPALMLFTQTEFVGLKTAWKSDAMAGSEGVYFQTAATWDTTLVALLSDGWETGGLNLNLATAPTYMWVAMTNEVVTRSFRTGTYTGNGNAARTITIDQQPKWVTIVNETGTSRIGVKHDTMVGEDYGQLEAAYNWISGVNGIELISTGFIVGTDFNVNNNEYNWIAGIY